MTEGLQGGLMRIRHYGWPANRKRHAPLPRLHQFLDQRDHPAGPYGVAACLGYIRST